MNEQSMQPFQGKFVDLSLRFADGRTREFIGVKLLSVGSGGGVVQDCWPTSFEHTEVVSCCEHSPSPAPTARTEYSEEFEPDVLGEPVY